MPLPSTDLLARRLRCETRDQHAVAERSGIMRAMLRGRISCESYCAVLRNFHTMYVALETALLTRAEHPCIGPIFNRVLFRSAAIARDLDALHGRHWATTLTVVPIAREYADRLAALAESDPRLLVAHAYVRYLGDLSGGQILAGIILAALQLDDDEGTHFYRFASDPAGLAATFRAGLARLPLDTAGSDAVVGEAKLSFSMHIALFEALA